MKTSGSPGKVYQTWETRAVNMKGSHTHKSFRLQLLPSVSVASGNPLASQTHSLLWAPRLSSDLGLPGSLTSSAPGMAVCVCMCMYANVQTKTANSNCLPQWLSNFYSDRVSLNPELTNWPASKFQNRTCYPHPQSLGSQMQTAPCPPWVLTCVWQTLY